MRLSPCGFASRDFPRFARLLLLRMISVLRSAVFLYSAPPSVVPIAARPIVPADSAPPAFQVPCTAPFHRQSLCPSRLFQTQDITVPAENAFKYRLGFQQFQPRGKSGIPPPPWRRQRDMRHAQLSFHCSTAHSGIQEDFSFSVCRPLHIIPLRGPPFPLARRAFCPLLRTPVRKRGTGLTDRFLSCKKSPFSIAFSDKMHICPAGL